MKPTRLLGWLLACTLILASSCRKAEEAKPEAGAPPPAETPAAPAGETPAVPAVTPPPATPAATSPDSAAIAAKIGFGAQLPKEFQTFTMIDLSALHQGVKGTAFGPQVEELMRAVKEAAPPAGESAAATPASPEPDSSEPAVAGDDEPVSNDMEDLGRQLGAMLVSGPIYFATGADTAVQSFHLLRLFDLIGGYANEATFMEVASDLGVLGEAAEEEGYFDAGERMMAEHETLFGRIEPMQMPGVVIAVDCKGRVEAARKMLAAMDGQMTEMAADTPFVKREEIQSAGGTFVTFAVAGGDVIAAEDLQGMLEGIDEAQAAKYHAILAAKKFCIGFGLKDENIVLFLGSEAAQLRFAQTPQESLAARPELGVLAETGAVKPFLVMQADGDVLAKMRAGQDPASLFETLRRVLKKCTGLGETKDIDALLGRCSENIREMYKNTDKAFGAAGWFQGEVMRVEALGGSDNPALDGSAPLAMAGKLAAADTVLAIHGRSNRAYAKRSIELVQDMAEIVYETAQRYAASEAGEENPISEPLGLFREKMLPHVGEIWAAVSGDNGLGTESAMIVDLGSPAPKFPGLPEAVAEKAPIPRVTMVWELEDREKLAASWGKIEPAIKGIIEALPLPEENRPALPDPFTSEKDGVKTWFYGISGLTNDNFVPSVSLSDKHFMMGSSKTLAETVSARLQGQAPAGEAPRGMLIELNFEALLRAAGTWLDLARDNAEALMPDEFQRDEFLQNEPQMRAALKVANGLRSLGLQQRPDGDRMRTSMQVRFAPAE
jgi:hypothetical protein